MAQQRVANTLSYPSCKRWRSICHKSLMVHSLKHQENRLCLYCGGSSTNRSSKCLFLVVWSFIVISTQSNNFTTLRQHKIGAIWFENPKNVELLPNTSSISSICVSKVFVTRVKVCTCRCHRVLVFALFHSWAHSHFMNSELSSTLQILSNKPII